MEKAYILKEIRRTAALNGGRPLGWRQFASKTGIKYHDWCGVHWARWNDAVRDAGFTPNRLTVKYPDSELFEKLASLAKELGRLPTSADLRLRAHEDKEFPSDRPFRRLGGKAEAIGKLAEYCRNRKDHEEVFALCERYLASDSHETEVLKQNELEFGEVYLMKFGKSYKIGKSNASGRREYELGIQLPKRIKIVHVIRTDDPAGIEAYWHQRFAAKRLQGEWFKLNQSDVAAFRRRKFQ